MRGMHQHGTSEGDWDPDLRHGHWDPDLRHGDKDGLGSAFLLGWDALPAFPLPVLQPNHGQKAAEAAAVALPLSFKASLALSSFLPSSPSH